MSGTEVNESLRETAIIDGCPMCSLEFEHNGPCAWICAECNGTQVCRECGDASVDDWGGCGECGGSGGCGYCYEGYQVDEY